MILNKDNFNKIIKVDDDDICIQDNSIDLSIENIYIVKPEQVYDLNLKESVNIISKAFKHYKIAWNKNDEIINSCNMTIPYIILNNIEYPQVIIEFEQDITMPSDCAGIVVSKSTTFRNGIYIPASYVDPGYNGKLHCLVNLPNNGAWKIYKGTFLAQLVVFEAKEGHYDGTYQKKLI